MVEEEETKNSGEPTAEGAKPAATTAPARHPTEELPGAHPHFAPRLYHTPAPGYPYYPPGMYGYPPPHQQYPHGQSAPHVPNLPHGYPQMPASSQAYPGSGRREQSGAVSHVLPQYVSPESRSAASAATAFVSPPSNLRRKPAASFEGTAKSTTLAPSDHRPGKCGVA